MQHMPISVQEFMNFSAATIAERTPAGQRQSVESESKMMKINERDG
jgi:synaptobrevin family protein YKT6